MADKEFNREIESYLAKRRSSNGVNFARIRKEVAEESVEEVHPGLSSDRIQIIKKEDSWMKRIVDSVTKKEQPTESQVSEPSPEAQEFEEEERMAERPGAWKRFVSWFRGAEEFEEHMEELDEKEEELLEEEEELLEKEEELEQERSRTIWSFLGRFRPGGDVNALQERMFDMQEDMKAIAKITTTVMRQLPPEALAQYKKTHDFEEFKEILKKHNLIREKQ